MDDHLTKAEKKELRHEEKAHWQVEMEKQRKFSLVKKIGIWVLGLGILVGCVWAVVAATSSPVQPTQTVTLPKVTDSDLATGPKDAPVTFVEYADFQCPACRAYYPLLKQLVKDEGNNMRFIYRYFPLLNIHQNAANATKAAYAANLQNKFWEMHDMLFENQNTWAALANPEDTFVGYAQKLGLNTAQFKKDYESSAAANLPQQAYSNDTNIGLNSTPTFFINGKQVLTNPQSYEALKKMVDEAAK